MMPLPPDARPHFFAEPRSLPQGAFIQSDGRVLWRLWAPQSAAVSLATWPDGQRRVTPMQPIGQSYFEHLGPGEEGLRYGYLLAHDKQSAPHADAPARPDPASRWQPDGVHPPSAVFDPAAYRWQDAAWLGVPREDLVIYELHVGTFTPEGTFAAIVPRLPQLRELGVTAIELMPIAQFPGERNWGYDGVHLYAAQNSYGGPRELQRLVDAAHQAGIGVILDVVYNHLGPEGNYLREFGPYFNAAYHTPWGAALNYDGPDSDPVRQFVCDNARMWVGDFHVDGLRLDAVAMIYDLGAKHILAEIKEAVDEAAAGRRVHVIGETCQNDMRLVNPPQRGGYGLDAVWADDFHYAMHALLTGERHGRLCDFGPPELVVKALSDVFVHDGGYSRFRRRRHGSPAGDADRSQFVICLKNHDQIGNRPRGDRPATYLTPAAQRLWCALSLLNPGVPLIFMGDEYGERRPFPFFCSFNNERLVADIRRGRRQSFEYMGFPGDSATPDPGGAATYASAKLSWTWSEPFPAGLRRLHQDLLAARREWPGLRDRRHTSAELLPAPLAPSQSAADFETGPEEEKLLVLRRGRSPGVVAVANLSGRTCGLPAELPPTPPLLSSEGVEYGGGRKLSESLQAMLPHEVLIFMLERTPENCGD